MEALQLQNEDWKQRRELLARGELAEQVSTADIQYKERKNDWEAAMKRELQLEEDLKKCRGNACFSEERQH